MPERATAVLPEGSLEQLAERIAACRLCRDHPRVGMPALPHEPRPVAILSKRASVLIAGQAPGLRVHQTGIPFNDPSGDRLRSWLDVTREQFYDPDLFAILPMGFCFPGYDARGSDLPPRPECAPAFRAEAMALMPQIRLVLAIGLYAQRWHMGPEPGRSLTDRVADWAQHLAKETRPLVLPMPHPSWRNSGWLRKNLWFEAEFLPVLRDLIKNSLS